MSDVAAPAATPAVRISPFLLGAGCFGVFAASCSGTTRAPFLIEMARDLAVSVPLMANLVGITSISWGIASMLAGAGSARWGRRPFLIGGPLAMALCMLGVSQAASFLGVVVWATIGGGCSGVFTGVIYAEISARVADRQRGRALGWVMSGQSLTLVLGVPLAAFIGTFVGWRGVNICVAGLGVMAAAMLLVSSRNPPDHRHPGGRAVSGMRAAMTPDVARLLAMGVGERVCYGLPAVYYATFLQTTYNLSLGMVALPLAVFAFGNILGTILGGQLADRLADRRRTFAVATLGSGITALALFGWTPDMPTSVGLGFFYVMFNAIARPALMASLAAVPDAVRGTVMGLNVTGASVGWLSAAGLGGIMMANFGFGSFGPLTAAFALATAAIAWGRRSG